MTKIKLIFILFFAVSVLYGDEFSDLVMKLSIYEDSVQAETDSLLVNLYPEETGEKMTSWITGDDWVKKTVAVRVLKKFREKESVSRLLNEKGIDASYGFRIFTGDSINFFTEYERPLKKYQYDSFIGMVKNRAWETDADEIIKIIETKNASDYIIVQGLNGLIEIRRKKNIDFKNMDERFFLNLFKKKNSAIDEKAVLLLSVQNSVNADSLFSKSDDMRNSINFIRFCIASGDTGRIEDAMAYYDRDKSSLSYMLDYEMTEYLKLFGDSLLKNMSEDEKYAEIKELTIKAQGVSDEQ